jgi:hypothetical protein
MARPETTKPSLATPASLMLAVSSSLSSRVRSANLAFDQLAAVSQQIAQVPERPRRHEAFGDEAVTDQIGDPLGILDVGPAAGHVTDVTGIADDQLKMALQDLDRTPIDTRAYARCR